MTIGIVDASSSVASAAADAAEPTTTAAVTTAATALAKAVPEDGRPYSLSHGRTHGLGHVRIVVAVVQCRAVRRGSQLVLRGCVVSSVHGARTRRVHELTAACATQAWRGACGGASTIEPFFLSTAPARLPETCHRHRDLELSCGRVRRGVGGIRRGRECRIVGRCGLLTVHELAHVLTAPHHVRARLLPDRLPSRLTCLDD